LVPQCFLSDGRWLCDYFARRIDAAQNACDPLDGFVPIADFDGLDWAWIKNAPAPVARELDPPIEDRYEQTQSQLQLREKQLRALTACYAQANAQHAQMLQSTSWRVTAPLRMAATVLRKWRARIFMLRTPIENKARSLVHRNKIRGASATAGMSQRIAS
jgi:hypothetical protein